MKKRDLLPIIESQLSQWDCSISQEARNFFRDELLVAHRSGKPLDPKAIELPCQDITKMALACLVASTGYSAEDFETVSDCLHMRSSMAAHTAAPQYTEALLNVLACCLFIHGYIEDGSAELAANEVPELINRLEALERVVESRYWLEKDLHAAAKAEQEARAKVSAIQRVKAQTKRTGEIQEIVDRLAREPLSAKELWPHFVSALGDTSEGDVNGQPFVNYDSGKAPRRMTLKSFSNRLSKARNPNSRG